MHVGKNYPRNDYRIGDVFLEEVSEQHDLSVRISTDLKHSLQCKEAAMKYQLLLALLKELS